MIRTTTELRANTREHKIYESNAVPAGVITCPCYYHIGKTIKIIQQDGSIRTGFMYGEKTFSYDKKEIEEYKEEQKIKKNLKRKEKELLNRIIEHYKTMDIDELETIANKLGV